MYGMVRSLTSTEQVYTLAEDMQHLVILLWPLAGPAQGYRHEQAEHSSRYDRNMYYFVTLICRP